MRSLKNTIVKGYMERFGEPSDHQPLTQAQQMVQWVNTDLYHKFYKKDSILRNVVVQRQQPEKGAVEEPGGQEEPEQQGEETEGKEGEATARKEGGEATARKEGPECSSPETRRRKGGERVVRTFEEEEEERRKRCLIIGQYVPVHLRNRRRDVKMEEFAMIDEGYKDMLPRRRSGDAPVQDMNKHFGEEIRAGVASGDRFRDLVE